MLSLILPDYPPLLLAYIFLAFLAAGVIKGFLGMGMPAVLMSMLTVFIPPTEAIALIVLPLVLVNVFQFLRSPHPKKTARRYGFFAAVMVAVIVLVASNITHYPQDLLLASTGGAMVLFALNAWVGFPIRLGRGRGIQAVFAVGAGIIGGLSALWGPVIAMYLMGRKVKKEAFIGALGFLFMVGSLALLLTFGSINLLGVAVASQSLVGLLVALLGFRIGEAFRGRLNEAVFRACILVAFFILGSRLLLASIF